MTLVEILRLAMTAVQAEISARERARIKIQEALNILTEDLGIIGHNGEPRAIPTAVLTLEVYNTLSAREKEIFKLLGEDLPTRSIAARLGIAKKTVEATRDNIRKKINVKTARELKRIAIQWRQ